MTKYVFYKTIPFRWYKYPDPYNFSTASKFNDNNIAFQTINSQPTTDNPQPRTDNRELTTEN
ncbi:hypothetical protein FGL01_27130 [Flavobacterium glycines]|uniref:Uncharacterized protein n=1 Tax=Flavobacterium glycines TaxID=551990 RepID=A0A511CL61_9FLAO|nr:hypothetical protein FGL01_27130 [Flavobacterium glycines]